MNYNPYQFGAYQAPSQRFGQFQGNYMPQPQNQQAVPQVASQPGMVMRPVTSINEASVYQIPFDGSTTWFYDTSGDKLYSKTFDYQTGTAPVITYIREQPAPVVQYAALEVVESLMQDLQDLKDEINRLKSRKGKKNESDVPDE